MWSENENEETAVPGVENDAKNSEEWNEMRKTRCEDDSNEMRDVSQKNDEKWWKKMIQMKPSNPMNEKDESNEKVS